MATTAASSCSGGCLRPSTAICAPRHGFWVAVTTTMGALCTDTANARRYEAKISGQKAILVGSAGDRLSAPVSCAMAAGDVVTLLIVCNRGLKRVTATVSTWYRAGSMYSAAERGGYQITWPSTRSTDPPAPPGAIVR